MNLIRAYATRTGASQMTPREKQDLYRAIAKHNQDAEEWTADLVMLFIIIGCVAALILLIWALTTLPAR